MGRGIAAPDPAASHPRCADRDARPWNFGDRTHPAPQTDSRRIAEVAVSECDDWADAGASAGDSVPNSGHLPLVAGWPVRYRFGKWIFCVPVMVTTGADKNPFACLPKWSANLPRNNGGFQR